MKINIQSLFLVFLFFSHISYALEGDAVGPLDITRYNIV